MSGVPDRHTVCPFWLPRCSEKIEKGRKKNCHHSLCFSYDLFEQSVIFHDKRNKEKPNDVRELECQAPHLHLLQL